MRVAIARYLTPEVEVMSRGSTLVCGAIDNPPYGWIFFVYAGRIVDPNVEVPKSSQCYAFGVDVGA